MDRTRFVYGLTTGADGAAAVGVLGRCRSCSNHEYMTDMKYGYRPDGGERLVLGHVLPVAASSTSSSPGFALVGFVACVVRRHLNGAWLGHLTACVRRRCVT